MQLLHFSFVRGNINTFLLSMFLVKLSAAVSSVSKCQPVTYCQFFLFFIFSESIYFQRKKKHHWGRDLSVYEHTWKAIFLHIKKPILYVHCREQNRTLWSYVLDFEEHNQSDFTLRNQQWQMLGWVIWKKLSHATLFMYNK